MSCCRTLTINGAPELTVGESIVFTVAPFNPVDKCTYVFPLCASWTGATGTEVVTITDGTTTYEVRNNVCNATNPLQLGFLRSHRCGYRPMFLKFVYGSEAEPHLTVLNELPNQCINVIAATAEA